jgi:hypothetical protein
MFIDNFTRVAGRFLLLRWEYWEVGGGAGVEWFIGCRGFRMPAWSPLWVWPTRKIRAWKKRNMPNRINITPFPLGTEIDREYPPNEYLEEQ